VRRIGRLNAIFEGELPRLVTENTVKSHESRMVALVAPSELPILKGQLLKFAKIESSSET
jgi:hypothetical protein